MERYRERADNTARAIDCSLHLALDAGAGEESPWIPVIQASGDEDLYDSLYERPDEASAARFLTFDERNPNSLLSCLGKARDNARSIREAIPSALWEEINTAYIFMKESAQGMNGTSAYDFYARVKRHCQAFTGIADATMSRDEAWHFGRIGTLLERADKTSRLLDVKYFLVLPSVEDVGGPADNVQWTALLESVGALEMFRKVHQQVIHSNVVGFLVLDRDFPRSILSCLTQAEASLHAITGTPASQHVNDAERLLGGLRSSLGFRRLDDIIRRGMHEFLDDVQARLNEIHDALAGAFFSPSLARENVISYSDQQQ